VDAHDQPPAEEEGDAFCLFQVEGMPNRGRVEQGRLIEGEGRGGRVPDDQRTGRGGRDLETQPSLLHRGAGERRR